MWVTPQLSTILARRTSGSSSTTTTLTPLRCNCSTVRSPTPFKPQTMTWPSVAQARRVVTLVAVRRRPRELSPVLAPSPLEGQAPGAGGDEIVDLRRSPGTHPVEVDLGRRVQQRMGDLPQPFDPFGVGEEGLVTTHGVVDQPIVGLEDSVGEVGLWQ